MLGLRAEAIQGAARYLSAGRGITMPEPGRTTVPYWVTSEAEARKAVEELAGHKVDIVKIWVDTRDGKYKKLTPEIYSAIIDEAHKRGLRVTAHDFKSGITGEAPATTPVTHAVAAEPVPTAEELIKDAAQPAPVGADDAAHHTTAAV